MVIKPRILFVSKLILFSSAIHALLLGMFFFVYHTQQPISLTLSGVAADVDWATITLVPLAKTIPGAQQKLQKSAQNKSTLAGKQPLAEQQKNTIQSKHVQQKKETKPANPSIRAASQRTQDERGTQIVQTKPVQKVAPKPIPKKQQPAPKVAKKEIVAQASQPVQTEQKVVEQNVVAEQQVQEMIYVGRDDRERLYLQHELYTQLAKQWQPPMGIPADTECVVKALIAKDGTIADVITDKTSGILVFDVAARAAIIETSFPQSVWGKEIIITFNQ